MGGRFKVNKTLSLTAEYGHQFNRFDGSPFRDPISVGLNIQVGGHVFQLIFSNSQQVIDSYYITNTTGDWLDGDFFFGFNLYHVF